MTSAEHPYAGHDAPAEDDEAIDRILAEPIRPAPSDDFSDLPDFVRPGATVVFATGRGFLTSASIRTTTVERIMKRDVVFADGTRMTRREVKGSHAIVPPGDPRIAEVRREIRRARAIGVVRAGAEQIRKATEAAEADQWHRDRYYGGISTEEARAQVAAEAAKIAEAAATIVEMYGEPEGEA